MYFTLKRSTIGEKCPVYTLWESDRIIFAWKEDPNGVYTNFLRKRKIPGPLPEIPLDPKTAMELYKNPSMLADIISRYGGI